jgi:hypothetical protein
MKLIYSLSKRTIEPHSDIVYSFFRISILMAKEAGYETELWGTSDAIQKLCDVVNSVVNVDDIEYELYDDIKMKIWETATPNITTIDGDVFLYNKLSLGGLWLNVDEKFTELSADGNKCLDSFNEFDIKSIIPEWDSTNKIGLSTGLVNWGKNDEFKKHYIESYWKLRRWYLDNQYDIVMKNAFLHNSYPAISHIICENLLYQLVREYDIEYKEFSTNPKNLYVHKAGERKYKMGPLYGGILTLENEIKQRGGSVTENYNRMVEGGYPPFLYLLE